MQRAMRWKLHQFNWWFKCRKAQMYRRLGGDCTWARAHSWEVTPPDDPFRWGWWRCTRHGCGMQSQHEPIPTAANWMIARG